jgi:hypothetical protein
MNMENYDKRRPQGRGQQNDERESSFSPDWSREGAEPRYSADRYYSRNRDYQQPRSDEPSRSGRWRGDQNRATTEEQRERSFEPREADRSDLSRSSGRGLYGSDDPQGEPDSDHNRSTMPYEYPGGRGNLYMEAWTVTGPHTGRGPKGYKRADPQLVEEASLRLERNGQVDATDIEVSAEDGVIRLRGTVADRSMKRRAEECVESVYGARDVMNELRVATATAAGGAAQETSAQTQEISGAGASSTTRPANEVKTQRAPIKHRH